ncbi:hypothetical protein ACIRJR_14210 [Streptomyces sp. NPDC102402]|uniref:hypothetical protein n=1 Tax=Streptomyces sp. NPDC102402 TaxID=3366169 RepID=UPI003816AEB6
MPVIPGEEFGLAPVGVVEEVVGSGVVRDSPVDHVKTMVSRERNRERRPPGLLPESTLEVAGRLVVRAEQQFLGLLALDTRREVPQPEERLVQEPRPVRQGATAVSRYPGGLQVCTVHHSGHHADLAPRP